MSAERVGVVVAGFGGLSVLSPGRRAALLASCRALCEGPGDLELREVDADRWEVVDYGPPEDREAAGLVPLG